MVNRWVLKPEPDPDITKALAAELGVDKLIAGLLVQRNIKTFDQARTFFRPTLSHFHDPFLMKDMDLAVDRLEHAISKQERILVYGDYDVDGTTSVALMAGYLNTTTEPVATYIPHR